MPLSTDPTFLDIACDVAIRFRGHGSYGNADGAIKALRRQAPGRTPEEYRSAFAFLCNVYDRAEKAIPNHYALRPDKLSDFAEFEDIDFTACMRELDEIEPGAAVREETWILNWCIFWCYLK